MTLFTGTNEKRVQKIIEIIDLLAKSVEANNATTDDIWKLMEPAINHIGAFLACDTPVDYGDEAPVEPVKSEHNPDSVEPTRITILNLANEAPLKDLSTAVSVYLHRVEEELIQPMKFQEG